MHEIFDSIVIETEKPAENGQGETIKSTELYKASGQHTFFGSILVNTTVNLATIFDEWTVTNSSHPCTDERELSHRSVVIFPPGGSIKLQRGDEKQGFSS